MRIIDYLKKKKTTTAYVQIFPSYTLKKGSFGINGYPPNNDITTFLYLKTNLKTLCLPVVFKRF